MRKYSDCTISDIFRKKRHLKVALSGTVTVENSTIYRGADKSLARAGRKQANVSVRMA